MSIATVLQAGAWIFTGATAAATLFALFVQVIRENYRTESFEKGSLKWEVYSRIYGKPLEVVSILILAALASLTKALAYWAQFYGVGVTGPTNFWGTQLGWIFFAFFTAMSLSTYVCLRETWRNGASWGFAAAAGAFFVAAFVATTNQLVFVLLGGVFGLLLLIAIGMFRVRRGTWAIVAIVLYALFFFIGYVLPYILSPNYMGSITILAALTWYLIADIVIVVWYVLMAFTAIECSEAVMELKAAVVCSMPQRAKLT